MTKSSISKIVETIKSKFQPIVGIWIGDYYKGGKGHVTTVVGFRINEETGEILGLFFNDPAGILNAKKSYRDDTLSGECVFYGKEMFPKIFTSNSHILYFELFKEVKSK